MKYRFHKLNGEIADEYLALSVAHPSSDPAARPCSPSRESWRRPSKRKSPTAKKSLSLRPVSVASLLEGSASSPSGASVQPAPVPPLKRRKRVPAQVPSPRPMLNFLGRKYGVAFFGYMSLDHLRMVISVDNSASAFVRLEYIPECRSFAIRELMIKGKILIGGSLLSSE